MVGGFEDVGVEGAAESEVPAVGGDAEEVALRRELEVVVGGSGEGGQPRGVGEGGDGEDGGH